MFKTVNYASFTNIAKTIMNIQISLKICHHQ